MALKIRLRQQGCTNHIVYRIVVADSRSPRDGKYIEAIGWYNPKAREGLEKFNVHADRLQHWLGNGAQISETVASIMKSAAAGVMQQHQQKLEQRRVKRAKARRDARKAA